MAQLTQGMYSSYDCNLFNLQYGQTRLDEVVRNASWYNAQGEKLGYGDINMDDLDHIFAQLQENDVFIILSEANSNWNMPANLDRFKPGAEYVMNHAAWVIAHLDMGIFAYKPVEHDVIRHVVTGKDLFEHFVCSRVRMFEDLAFENGTFTTIKTTPQTTRIDYNDYYGLDVYNLTNGQKWAVGSYAASEKAALLRAREYIAFLTEDNFEDILSHSMSSVEIRMIYFLAKNFEKEANDHIINWIGENRTTDLAKLYLSKTTKGSLLSEHSSTRTYSDDVKGLPKGLLAYRID